MATAAATNSLFEIEVPKPLSMFRDEIISESNQRLLRDAIDQRYLTPAKRRKYQRLVKILSAALKRLGYDELEQQRQQLRRQHFALAVQIHTLKEAQGDTHEITELEYRDAALKAQYARLLDQMRSKREPQPARFALNSLKRQVNVVIASDMSIADLAALRDKSELRLKQHAAAVQYEKDARRREKEMVREAHLFARIIKERWAALGFRHITYDRRGKRKVRRVGFQRIEVTEDVLYFKISATSLGIWGESHNLMPEGVSVNRLLHKDVIDDLTMACQREVWTPHIVDESSHFKGVKYTNGAWLCINRLDANDGLLSYVELEQVMATFPSERMSHLPFPAGVKRGRVVNWVELRAQPHLLIAGQTGSGKSNVFNVILTTAFTRYTPDDVRIVLVDLKEGVGFKKYEGLPHLAHPQVITELNDFQNILEALERERYHRTMKIRTLAESIDDYNAIVNEKLPRIIVLCDEYQEVASAKKELRDAIHTLTHKLAAKGRSAGIHLILGTQSPFSDMIPGKIKANITFVLSGRQRTLGASFSAFGSKVAAELPKIAGRMLCDDGVDLFQVQMPFVSPEAIGAAIKAARQKYADIEIPSILSDVPVTQEIGTVPSSDESQPPAPESRFGRDEIIAFALEKSGGVFNARAMWESQKMTLNLTLKHFIDHIKRIAEGGKVEYLGTVYFVVRHGKGWRLEPETVNSITESAAD